MTRAMLAQVTIWTKALRQANKAIRVRNKHINRLQMENALLNKEMSALREEIIQVASDMEGIIR